ncbi:MAG TPA: metallophosphoesterase family protein [Terriglobales bacterium]|nr:metallophosphoesterase family protein [Terriglobales bacterium]
MIVAVVSDVHGNLPALEAVLDTIDRLGVDLVVSNGDVAAGPMPRETIERLVRLGDRARFVRGNADRALVAGFDGVPVESLVEGEETRARLRWTVAQLDRRHRDFMAGFADRVVVDVEGLGLVLCCHASARNDDLDVFTARSPDQRVLGFFPGVTEGVVTCGHTHMQFDRGAGDLRVVNVGSVGMPYGEPGAYWALLGPDVTLCRTAYDLQRAAELIRATGYPDAGQFAERNVLRPPTAAEALDLFERHSERRS